MTIDIETLAAILDEEIREVMFRYGWRTWFQDHRIVFCCWKHWLRTRLIVDNNRRSFLESLSFQKAIQDVLKNDILSKNYTVEERNLILDDLTSIACAEYQKRRHVLWE